MIGLGSDKKTIRLFCNLYRSFPVVGRSRTHNPLFQNILFINYTNILLALCCSIWLKAIVNHAIWFGRLEGAPVVYLGYICVETYSFSFQAEEVSEPRMRKRPL